MVAAAIALFLYSCAPRFTVYIDVSGKMNTYGITVLSVDTTSVAGYKQKKVSYVVTKDMGRIESSINRRRQSKIKEEVDKLSKQ
jgi:hypothetical protein